MNSQFVDPLPLKDPRTIKAKGPLLDWRWWDAPHCKISVVLTQGAPPNEVRGTGDTGSYGREDTAWECDVRAKDAGGNDAVWDPTQEVHCVGTIKMSRLPPAGKWDPQDVSLT
jgi:hypothetical protein